MPSRTLPPEDDLDVMREQTRRALERAEREPMRREDDWRELTPVINVNVGREQLPTKPDSDPPVASGGLALTKSGVKIGKLPPGAVVAIVLGLGVVAAVAYVLTH